MTNPTVDYKSSVFLPKTSFGMRANLVQKEPEILKYWHEQNLYQKIRQNSKGKPKFILHYGPPYANGNIHIGHAFSEILKDILNKYFQMQGYDAPLIPGWDCHGLPIEWKIEEEYRKKNKQKEDVPREEFINACRNFAKKWVEVQSEELQRLGIVADWQNPYITMDFKIEASICQELGKFLMNGSLYRGVKPVLWSVIEKTALAEAEVEYHDKKSDAIYVGFPILKTPVENLKNAKAVIWTTTPWTIPANRAIAYNKELTYSVIEVKKTNEGSLIKSGDRYLVAQDLLQDFTKCVGIEDYLEICRLQGDELIHTIASHPLKEMGYNFDVPLLPGDHVTSDAGTGLVHTAPTHGLEDFELGKKYDLELPEYVMADGVYAPQTPGFAGQHIFKVNPNIIEAIKNAGHLLISYSFNHSYPHSWRSKAPLIYRATSQWFISMDHNDLRKKTLDAITKVKWTPSQGENRIRSMVESRPAWCLSRQRAWGVPITLFIHKHTGEPLRDEKVHQRIVDKIAIEGVEAWHHYDNQTFLGNDHDPELYEKITDILDVWFDSGCSHRYVVADRPELGEKADIYFEGSDQHRGWFQSSLLESVGTTGEAPYKNVLTHGFVLDEKGYKMSKSQGNVVSPQEIIKTLGADILRLWIANTDYAEDVRVGKDILKQAEDIYRRLRNTLRYLLGALAEYKGQTFETKDLPKLEQWVLHRLAVVGKAHKELGKNYNIADFTTTLHTFCSNDLSATYFDIRKDVLYCDGIDSHKRQSALYVMNCVFQQLIHWLAPIISYTAEEAWHTYNGDQKSSIHMQQQPEIAADWLNQDLNNHYANLLEIRQVISGAIEVERATKTLGSSLQAHVFLYVAPELLSLVNGIDWQELAIVSQVSITSAAAPAHAFCLKNIENIAVVVEMAEGEKCQRCWKILPEVGQQPITDLCKRCDLVINKQEKRYA